MARGFSRSVRTGAFINAFLMLLLAVRTTHSFQLCRPPFPRSILKSTGGVDNAVADTNVAVPRNKVEYDMEAYISGYRNCEKECCETLEGSVPVDLTGTYFRNGYGKFEVGSEKQKVVHPFDSDGMVIAAQFKDGKVLFRNRFVRTEGYCKERNAKGLLYRNTFGSQRKGGFLANAFDTKFKNVANTNVLYRGDALYALWEGGLPHRLEPDSLATVCEDNLGGVLAQDETLTAHPRFDSATGRTVAFTCTARSPRRSSMRVYEFDEDMGVHSTRDFDVEGFPFFHDFVVTSNYYIFELAPTTFNPLPFLFGFKGPANCIGFDGSKPSKIMLVPRDAPEKDVEIVDVEPHFNFHYGNAYDEGPGKIVFDVVKTDEMFFATSNINEPIWNQIDWEKDVPYSTLQRYTLTKDETGSWQHQSELLSPNLFEFPSTAPSVSCQKHRYIYGVSSPKLGVTTPQRSIIKVDTEARTQAMWTGEPHEFVGEPLFLPRDGAGAGAGPGGEGEDDGYLVTVLWDGRAAASALAVFDARDVAKGPVSRLPLPTALPHGLHGAWAPGLVFEEGAVRARFEATAQQPL